MEEDSHPQALEVYKTQPDKDLGIWCDKTGSWTSSPKLSSNLNYSIILENTICFLLHENCKTVGFHIPKCDKFAGRPSLLYVHKLFQSSSSQDGQPVSNSMKKKKPFKFPIRN